MKDYIADIAAGEGKFRKARRYFLRAETPQEARRVAELIGEGDSALFPQDVKCEQLFVRKADGEYHMVFGQED